MISNCCSAPAKVDQSGEGTGFYWCTKCICGCDVHEPRSKPRSTLSNVRKPSGERALFIQLYAKCKGKSQVSGEPLLSPEHPMFHFQGSHLLPKGTYPDYRLDERNIIMVTADEHKLWHDKGPEGLVTTWGWIEHVSTYYRLKEEAHRKGRSTNP